MRHAYNNGIWLSNFVTRLYIGDYIERPLSSFYVTMSYNHGIWLSNFVTKLYIGDYIERSLKFLCDHVVLYCNNNNSTKSKINIKFLIVRERIPVNENFLLSTS